MNIPIDFVDGLLDVIENATDKKTAARDYLNERFIVGIDIINQLGKIVTTINIPTYDNESYMQLDKYAHDHGHTINATTPRK